MKTLLLVGAGSMLGGILRYVISGMMQGKTPGAFPLGTLIVNLTGCLIIGILLSLVLRSGLAHAWRMFLAAGFCGGFTTFSAFSMETLILYNAGQVSLAVWYVLASVAGGLLMTLGGYVLCDHVVAG